MISQRPMFLFRIPILSLCILIVGVGNELIAGEPSVAHPGWSPIIVPTGEYRAEIKSMPIELRPYRPLHFYGNTVRRNYYQNLSAKSLATQQSLSQPMVAQSMNRPSIAAAPTVRRGRGIVARTSR